MFKGLLATPWCRAWLIVLFALILHSAGTSVLPLIDRDEPRFAEATREMLESGDFIVPHFNQAYRFDKPVLIYWCQALSIRLLGDTDFAVRLPSVIAAALTALVTYGFGRRAAGEWSGFWAAMMLTTALQTMVHAKMAVADFLMIFFVTVGFWAGWELGFHAVEPGNTNEGEGNRGSRRTFWWWTFYSSQALAFLAKGPIGWLPLLVGIILCLRRSTPVSQWKFGPGVALMLGIVALWGIPALWATGGEFLKVGIGRHVIQRSVGTLEGHGASRLLTYVALMPLYFLTVFPSFFPWSIHLPWLLKRFWREGRRTVLEGYLITGVITTFVIFSLVRTKLPHYTLPCFPLLALWLAERWLTEKRSLSLLSWTWAVGAALGLGVSCLLIPRMAPFFPTNQLYSALEPQLDPGMEFASCEFDEPSLVWYFRHKIHGFHHPVAIEGLQPFMEQSGPRFCVLPTRLVASAFPKVPGEWKRFDSKGINFVHGRRTELTALVKTLK